MSLGPRMEDAHMTEIELAAYLDRRLTATERSRAEDHLSACAACRGDLVATERVMARASSARRVLAGAATAVAAAAVLLVAIPALRGGTGGREEAMRSVSAPNELRAHGPIGEAASAALRFAWEPAAGATTYRLTVSSPEGATLWTGSRNDTTATLPEAVALTPGRSYYWVADALLADGTTRSTGLREFRLTR